ncbi:15657_t:CDS:2 [Funneliformis geosporum]|nr:15657_t:CDS:2 [Funneliformis geosporum]
MNTTPWIIKKKSCSPFRRSNCPIMTIGMNTFLTGKNPSSLKISLAINCQRAYQSHEGLMSSMIHQTYVLY